MELFVWSDAIYSVGVAEFDGHHRKLVGLINTLFDGMSQGKGYQVLAQILDELTRYAQYHFAAEERLMDKTRYPDAAQHKNEHQYFAAQVKTLVGAQQAGKGVLSADVLDFMRSWLANHITVSDKAYGVFLNKQGIN